MVTDVRLPQWLDNLIFDQLGAKYQRSNADMTVIDWDKNDVLNYLGTYFPRSYAESYCIFSEFFKSYPERYSDKSTLTVFDFGCGTGGEIIGMLTAINKHLFQIKNLNIYALDGNYFALRLYEKVLNETGYNVKVLKECSMKTVEIGLKHVNNDACYPSILTTGQLIEALKSGKYDINKG